MIEALTALAPELLAALGGGSGFSGMLGGGGAMAGAPMAGGMQGPTQGKGFIGMLSGGGVDAFNNSPFGMPSFGDEKKQPAMHQPIRGRYSIFDSLNMGK